MVITKVFNNNAVIAKDTENREIVLMGCGIAFKKKNGDEVDKQLLFLALINDIIYSFFSLVLKANSFKLDIGYKELLTKYP